MVVYAHLMQDALDIFRVRLHVMHHALHAAATGFRVHVEKRLPLFRRGVQVIQHAPLALGILQGPVQLIRPIEALYHQSALIALEQRGTVALATIGLQAPCLFSEHNRIGILQLLCRRLRSFLVSLPGVIHGVFPVGVAGLGLVGRLLRLVRRSACSGAGLGGARLRRAGLVGRAAFCQGLAGRASSCGCAAGRLSCFILFALLFFFFSRLPILGHSALLISD